MRLVDPTRLSKAAGRPTAVFDLYWRFAAERQATFFRRLEGAGYPWTNDSILQTYRFTNVYRASDRVSQFLIQHVIYDPKYSKDAKEVAFRILLFKLFNKEATWKLLEAQLGLLTWQTFSPDKYDRVLTEAAAKGARLYSAAYIIPPVALGPRGVKHRGHLRLVELILGGNFVARLQDTRDLKEVFALLKSYPSFGEFLAFQLAIDFNYSELIDHDEGKFVVAGPGARDGLAKTFPDASSQDTEVLITLMMERQEMEFERLGLNFRTLWGRRLQLIDCQNLFCEISKYTRISHPEIGGVSGRTRIKQKFIPGGTLAQPWYPPKWALNQAIPTYASNHNPNLLANAL
jgi:alpha-glutamyl/putrescinyl thymine pyrophosphorylase clade 1